MIAFVAVVGRDRGIPDLPASCVAALQVPGAGTPVLYAGEGFSCAAATTGDAPIGLIANAGTVACGDVRLDDRAAIETALAGPAPFRPDPHAHLALVLAAHGRWGSDATRRLAGDFSYVHWDGTRHELVAARDGLGVRPLYYAAIGPLVVVSNLLNAVRAHPAVSSALRDEAVGSFLRHGWNTHRGTTTFADIQQVPPGCALIAVRGGTLRSLRHWAMPDPDPLHLRDEREYVERYRMLLRAAVVDRIVPGRTALLLSGGMDSPSLAAAAADAGLINGLEAVTTRVTDVETPVEGALATAVAEHFGLRHRLVESTVDPRPEVPRATPEPHDDPEYEGTREYFNGIGRTSSVVLEGEDGDALFSPPGLFTMLRRESPVALLARVAAYTLRHGHHPHTGFRLRRRLGLRPGPAPVVRPEWLRDGVPDGPIDPSPTHAARPEAVRSLGSSIWQAVHDGRSRAVHGAPVDFRWPFLDARLIAFVFAIPAVPWCQRKWLARRAYAADLPRAITTRRKTTIPGYFDRMVHVWRTRTGGRTGQLTALTRAYVDPDRLAGTLRGGDTEAVLAAWRAVQFDQWARTAGIA